MNLLERTGLINKDRVIVKLGTTLRNIPTKIIDFMDPKHTRKYLLATKDKNLKSRQKFISFRDVVYEVFIDVGKGHNIDTDVLDDHWLELSNKYAVIREGNASRLYKKEVNRLLFFSFLNKDLGERYSYDNSNVVSRVLQIVYDKQSDLNCAKDEPKVLPTGFEESKESYRCSDNPIASSGVYHTNSRGTVCEYASFLYLTPKDSLTSKNRGREGIVLVTNHERKNDWYQVNKVAPIWSVFFKLALKVLKKNNKEDCKDLIEDILNQIEGSGDLV